MSINDTKAVQELYVAYFNRPADAAGLAYWLQVRGENVANPNTAAVSAAFAASAEYAATYNQATDRLKVAAVYEHLFGRAAETAGLDYWAGLMSSHTLTIDNVVTAIANGAQGNDSVVIDGKVDVATAFTAALDLDSERAAYATPTGTAAVSAYLSTIVDSATLASALAPTSIASLILAMGGTIEPTIGGGIGPAIGSTVEPAIVVGIAPLDLPILG